MTLWGLMVPLGVWKRHEDSRIRRLAFGAPMWRRMQDASRGCSRLVENSGISREWTPTASFDLSDIVRPMQKIATATFILLSTVSCAKEPSLLSSISGLWQFE